MAQKNDLSVNFFKDSGLNGANAGVLKGYNGGQQVKLQDQIE